MASAAEPDDRLELVASTSSLLDSCIRAFGSILKQPLDSNQDYINSTVNLHDELGRLRLWAGSFGAHRKEKDRLSLDHRLREAPELHKLVRDHLSDIYDALSCANNIVLDPEYVSRCSKEESTTPESEDSSDSDASSAGLETRNPSLSDLEEYLLDIRHTITSLYKFSVTLQNPATRDKTKKASRIDVSFYEVFDIQHASEKFGLPADCILAQRLGRANTRRRQLLAYYKDHDQKISKYIDVFMGNALQSSSTPKSKTSGDQRDVVSLSGIQGAAASTKSTEWTQDTTVSTVRMPDVDATSDSGRTVFSTTTSAAGDESSTIPVPPPPDPEAAARQEPFNCQICCQIIIVKNSEDDWKYHVFSDLRPYICTFDNCVQANQLYDSYTEWSEHERQFHRREWVCNLCSRVYKSQLSFSAHIQSSHAGVFSKDQLQVVIRGSERPITTPQQCPLCTKRPIDNPVRFQKHLARHLQQFSLFIISRGSDPEAPQEMTDSASDLDESSTARLRRRLKESRIRSHVEQSHFFIPSPTLQRLVSKSVHDILVDDLQVEAESVTRYAEIISQRAARLFAILVGLQKEHDIIKLLDEGIKDNNLPFIRVTKLEESNTILVTKQGAPIHTLKTWDARTLQNIAVKQYRVLSPVFCRHAHYELDGSDILPFVEDDTELESWPEVQGGFAEVYPVRIHRDHHQFGQNDLTVAVKRTYLASDFRSERKAYLDLGPSAHPHIIDLLFTYEYRKSFHLVFPCAAENLRNYWQTNPNPVLNPQFFTWTVQQMTGIANGLAYFHEFEDRKTGETRFGRHGDIKAENIFRFPSPLGPGILKIADLGHATIHSNLTQASEDPKTVKCSPTYSPPDALRGWLITRKFDIWGLGCLYLEWITYLLLGNQAITDFSNKRLERSTTYPELWEDNFYTAHGEVVNAHVVVWVDKLKRLPHCSQMMHDILDLITTKMIVIVPEMRSSAQEISQHLKQFFTRAQEDENYLAGPTPLPRKDNGKSLKRFTTF
ncbi:hypothetical protein ASPCAL06227 [Aspergillus calidoustus]|uniref:Protein kinase domain-containing protein n=1 Tax=Aspergillus calidoustus TaxID=454130 RepID=A0A0U5G0F8_ASPCI|nr:hypothetical protein ASPCAL06227 [Aspergillus calidoustus]